MRAASTIGGGAGRRAAAGDWDDNDRKSSAAEAARQRARLESPEGQRLLREYLAARRDPKARAQQDAYLRQLEQDADATSEAVVGGGTIPEGKALVWPRAEGFVAKARRVRVRARQQGQGETEEEEQKVFLNVVVSERMPPPAFGEGGRAWRCPNALGPARVEEDSAGHPAIAYDFLVHPEAAGDERLRDTLMETAAEAVARMEAGKGKGKSEWRLRDSFIVLRNRTYMGAHPTPPAMLIDRAALVPEPHPPQQPPSTKTAAAAAAFQAQTPAPPSTSAAPAAPPADAAARQRAAAAAATTTTTTPRYTITERQHHPFSGPQQQQQQPHGGKGAAAAGGGSSTSTTSSLLSAVPSALAAGSLRRQPPPRQRPGELVLRVQLPGVASAAALALDLAERELILESSPSSFNNKTPPQYALRLRLPYPVCVGRESASFSRKRAELTVTLPVCPPPAPSPPATEEAAETNANAGDALRSAAREEPGQQQEQQQRPPAADVNPHARWVEREGGVGDRLVLDPKAQQAPAQGATQREEQQQRKEEEAAVLASSYVTPAYQVQQRPGCFSLIVDAPGVDPGSVEAAWANDDGAAGGTGATMTLAFHGGGGSAEERRHCYRLRLRLWGRVDPQGCRVDVASRNVLVVVRKAKEKEAGAGWWPRFEAEDKGAAGGGGGKREAGAPLKPALENSHVFELAE